MNLNNNNLGIFNEDGIEINYTIRHHTNTDYLLDKEFLKQLDVYPHKEKYVKIISLSFEEEQMDEIQGKVISGTVNIDGTSAVRRTCNISLVAQDIDINEFYWGLNTKFKVEIGLLNEINDIYPEIIWFPMGIYVITSFSESIQTNNHTINISGKDKMCLINGEVGGHMHALTTDFGTIDETNSNGIITRKSRLIKSIIRDAVHEYAREPMDNIIINDLDDMGLELMEYRGKQPLYMFINNKSSECTQVTLDSDKIVYLRDQNFAPIAIKDIEVFDSRIELDAYNLDIEPTVVCMQNYEENLNENPNYNITEYTVVKVEYGNVPGYRTTGLTYAGDLILNAGEALTAMLDKIVNMLGEFEYFYDLDGHFIFQKKKTYINTSFNNIVNHVNEQYTDSAMETSSSQYSFEGNNLISSFQNTPNLQNLRNDFSIWGARKGLNGNEWPVHLRFAIDHKPLYYKTMAGKIYYSKEYKDYYIKKIRSQMSTQPKDEYELQYAEEMPAFLKRPVRNIEGQWENGWWDIRDWYNYYTLMTGEEPNGSLPWYTYGLMDGDNDPTKGNIPYNDIIEDARLYNWNIEGNNPEAYCWMISLDKNEKTIDFSHGISKLDTNYVVRNKCISYYVNDPRNEEARAKYSQQLYNTDLDKIICTYITNEQAPINPPYNVCHPAHTYLYMLEHEIKTKGKQVYIYSPNFENIIYNAPSDASISQQVLDQLAKGTEVDWRELIYQMVIDYRHLYYNTEDFLIKLRNNNGYNDDGDWWYPNGITGYEQYYTDIEGFWRQLYCPEGDYYNEIISRLEHDNAPYDTYFMRHYDRWSYNFIYTDINYLMKNNPTFVTSIESINVTVGFNSDESTAITYYKLYNDGKELVPSEHIGEIYGFIDREGKNKYYIGLTKYFAEIEFDYSTIIGYYKKGHGWREEVLETPELLNFWFDFLDSDAQMAKYAVPVIGDRTKSTNDNDVKAIYFRETPTVIFYDPKARDQIERKSGFTYIQCPSYMESLFQISTQGKSAKDVLDNYLYNYSYCIESISVTALPVYYLEPNTRVFIHDNVTGINGEYIVSRMTLPLQYNGTMNLTATKAAERLY